MAKKAPKYGGYSGASQASTVDTSALNKKMASASAPAPAPQTLPSGAPYTPNFSSGGGGSYGGGGGSYAAAASTPAPPPMDPNAWLNAGADQAYQAQMAALQKALSDYQADNTHQKDQYTTDFTKSLGQLGWTPGATNANDVNGGQWNFTDQNTASGKAYQNQLNDFASRGLLQSSLYGQANNDLLRSLTDQLSGLETSKSNFMTNLAQQLSAYQNQNTASQQQAKADALARYSAQFGV